MDTTSDDVPPLKSQKSQKSLSTRQSRGKVFVPPSLPKSSSSGLPLPVLLHKELKDAWMINKDRTLLLQRDIDVENFTACCNLIDLLRSQNLLQTVTNGFQKHKQEEELFITSKYTIDKRLFLKSHFDDCSALKSVVVSKGESVPSNLPHVSLDFAAVRARVLSTQSILTGLKSTVVQMEKVLLEDKKFLQSFEADDVDSDSAPTR
nr:uncharacterized protein LOC109166029 [Ipomoea batatas]GMC52847.1 uncharacterized protein LOC109166029 [Ipomoea batatas]